VGDLVLVYDPNAKKNKLGHHWIGPFPIIGKISEFSYRIDFGEASRRFQVRNAHNLKLFNTPAAKEEDEEDLDTPTSTEEDTKCDHTI